MCLYGTLLDSNEHTLQTTKNSSSDLGYFLLDAVSGNEAVDHDFVELSYSVSSGKSLDVVVRVPVRVVNKHRVRCRQVNSW